MGFCTSDSTGFPVAVYRLKERFCTREERKTERKPRGQPRPNVLFEAGMALARHPEKTLLVQIGAIRELSDIGGKHVVRLDDSFDKRNDVANRLEHLGVRSSAVGPIGPTWGISAKLPPINPKVRVARPQFEGNSTSPSRPGMDCT